MPDPLVLKIISFCLQHLSLVAGLLFREEAVKLSPASTDTPVCMGKVVRCVRITHRCFILCVENGVRVAMVCAGIGQLGVNIPAQSTYYHSNMKYWNISTIMHVLCNTLLILLGEASNLSCPPPTSFGFICTLCCCKRF